MRDINPKEREKFRKILILMQEASLAGEKAAAKAAAERMAKNFGMTLNEAMEEILAPQWRLSPLARARAQEEKAAKQAAYDQWHFTHGFTSETRYHAMKQAWAEAMQAANNRRQAQNNQSWQGFHQQGKEFHEEDQDNKQQGRKSAAYRPRYRPSHYRPTAEDRFRLISGLLLDGASIARTANLSDASTQEVMRVWLTIRHLKPNWRVGQRLPPRMANHWQRQMAAHNTVVKAGNSS